MEYIRYILYRNKWRILAVTIILMTIILSIIYINNKNGTILGKSFVLGNYNKSEYSGDNTDINNEIFKDILNNKIDLKKDDTKPIIISELITSQDRRVINLFASLFVAISISFFIFLFIPILLRNSFVNKNNLSKDLKIPFLTYYNSHFPIDKKADKKKEKAKEAKEEQLGELVAKIFTNTKIKNEKYLLFISDGIREDKIDIIFELSSNLSNLNKKVLILDLPLEHKKEKEKVEKTEKKRTKKDQIKKLTTFEDKLILKIDNNKELQKEIQVYSLIDKNVKYVFCNINNEDLIPILLKKDKILDQEYLNNFDYVLVNGVDSLDPERYIPLANIYPNLIVLTKHFKTKTESLVELKNNIDYTDSEIVGNIIVKKEKYNN